MSTDDREAEYDRIDRLVDEDPIALRDLAWKLLNDLDEARRRYHEQVEAVRQLDDLRMREIGELKRELPARGYRKAVERLRSDEHRRDSATWAAFQRAAAYLEATEGDDRG